MKVPISLHKADLPVRARLRGQVNADPLEIEGTTHAPGNVVYVGFAGAHVGDGIYEGHYVFRECQPRDGDADRFVKQDLWPDALKSPVETQGGMDTTFDTEIEHGIH